MRDIGKEIIEDLQKFTKELESGKPIKATRVSVNEKGETVRRKVTLRTKEQKMSG